MANRVAFRICGEADSNFLTSRSGFTLDAKLDGTADSFSFAESTVCYPSHPGHFLVLHGLPPRPESCFPALAHIPHVRVPGDRRRTRRVRSCRSLGEGWSKDAPPHPAARQHRRAKLQSLLRRSARPPQVTGPRLTYSVTGIGKGTLVREVDALDGLCARVSGECIHPPP